MRFTRLAPIALAALLTTSCVSPARDTVDRPADDRSAATVAMNEPSAATDPESAATGATGPQRAPESAREYIERHRRQ